jgi:hypothetical protein
MPTIDTARLAKLPPLSAGGHASRREGMCVLEAIAYVRGLPHSDHPPCVSGVIGAFLRSWNDALPTDADRDRLLKPLILDVVGTATTPEDEETRAWMATDWLCRVHTPAWLRLAGLTTEAEALEACARIVDAVTARSAQPALDRARQASAAAGAAARDAAWAAARAAAWDAAGAAAWDAARDAARERAAEALRATVGPLQESAVALIRAMCAVGRGTPTEPPADA